MKIILPIFSYKYRITSTIDGKLMCHDYHKLYIIEYNPYKSRERLKKIIFDYTKLMIPWYNEEPRILVLPDSSHEKRGGTDLAGFLRATTPKLPAHRCHLGFIPGRDNTSGQPGRITATGQNRNGRTISFCSFSNFTRREFSSLIPDRGGIRHGFGAALNLLARLKYVPTNETVKRDWRASAESLLLPSSQDINLARRILWILRNEYRKAKVSFFFFGKSEDN